MSTTTTPSINPVAGFFEGLVSDIKSFFGSTVGLEVTEFLATAAGIGSSLAVIEEVNPSNKTGTANDVYTLASAALTLLSGTTPPTLAQIQAAFTAFKSNTATSNYASLATTLSAALSNYLAKYSGSNWIQVATAFITGWQYGAAVLGGAAGANAPTVAPVVVAAPATTPNS